MTKAPATHTCRECGHRAHQWAGKCPTCGTWESMVAAVPARRTGTAGAVLPLAEIDPGARPRFLTGIGELDRVLGGGLVPGSVVLLAGEPGIGKSTLTLQASEALERGGRRVLMVCGEESLEQVAARARRIGTSLGGIRATSSTNLATVLGQASGFGVVIVDSIQTLSDAETSGEAGSVSQVRGCAAALAGFARASGTTVLLIGHVTKEGSVAGPRVLEHVVDAVLTFEGDRAHVLRMVRASKNRFGPTAEVGVFEMGAQGLREVADASQLFLIDRDTKASGSAVGCVLEGRRPLALEVQTLVAGTSGPPRRVANGVDTARLGVAAAVLIARTGDFGKRINGSDIYASIPGGFRTAEPGLDLALVLAMASAHVKKPVPEGVAAVGEVGLGGEIRSVPAMDARLAELARLGFKRVVVPSTANVEFKGIALWRAPNIEIALHLLDIRIG
jgi:DNA repair protein RadA/Sms